jgi:alkanesulfonate monooxygenase SsuD/methylene tetrahydromethanopterin reductase-like flavin-dependent oxidoreductase (luciferase family)
MLSLSVVDQSPVREGGTAGDALRETIDLAVAAEGLGYRRYWLAEHHRSCKLFMCEIPLKSITVPTHYPTNRVNTWLATK